MRASLLFNPFDLVERLCHLVAEAQKEGAAGCGALLRKG